MVLLGLHTIAKGYHQVPYACKYQPVTHCRHNCVRPTGWQSHCMPSGILWRPKVKGSKNWGCCCCWEEKTLNFSYWGEWKTFHWLWGLVLCIAQLMGARLAAECDFQLCRQYCGTGKPRCPTSVPSDAWSGCDASLHLSEPDRHLGWIGIVLWPPVKLCWFAPAENLPLGFPIPRVEATSLPQGCCADCGMNTAAQASEGNSF